MRHGPNTLIDENLPVVVLATRDEFDSDSMVRYEKSVSYIQEVKGRDGIITSSKSSPRRSRWPRFWRSCRCGCLLTILQCVGAATSTSPATCPNRLGRVAMANIR